MRYLYGPGRHNEHEDPRLVAAWDLAPAPNSRPSSRLSWPDRAPGGAGLRGLIGEMELATAPCALRRARSPPTGLALPAADRAGRPGPDRRRVGRRRAGPDAPDRHRPRATRARAGGSRSATTRSPSTSWRSWPGRTAARARMSNDYRRVRETCLAAEQQYGLAVDGAGGPDRRDPHHPRRGGAAARTAGPESSRAGLAARAGPARRGVGDPPPAFLDRLRVAASRSASARDADGTLTGYAVARPGSEGETVFYGGGKLAADLSLPKLQARWALPPATTSGAPAEPFDVRRADLAVRAAAGLVRQQSGHGETAAAADVASASSDLLRAAAWAEEGAAGGALTRAARQYDRAARESSGAAVRRTAEGTALRGVARALLATHFSQRGSAGDWAKLVLQLHDLVVAVAELRQAQQRTAQAVAARRTAGHLDVAARAAARSAMPAWAAQLSSPRATAPTASPAARRPALPPPMARGTGRSR